MEGSGVGWMEVGVELEGGGLNWVEEGAGLGWTEDGVDQNELEGAGLSMLGGGVGAEGGWDISMEKADSGKSSSAMSVKREGFSHSSPESSAALKDYVHFMLCLLFCNILSESLLPQK